MSFTFHYLESVLIVCSSCDLRVLEPRGDARYSIQGVILEAIRCWHCRLCQFRPNFRPGVSTGKPMLGLLRLGGRAAEWW